MQFKQISSSRLSYRPFTLEDRDFCINLLGSPQVCKYLPGPDGYPIETIDKVLNYYIQSSFGKDPYQKIYLVTRQDTNKPIGYAGIQLVKEFSKYEIFYGFIPSAWGKGFASEAAEAMQSLAEFQKMKELIALADVRNKASQRVLEKTGFTKVKEIPLWGLNLVYYEMKM